MGAAGALLLAPGIAGSKPGGKPPLPDPDGVPVLLVPPAAGAVPMVAGGLPVEVPAAAAPGAKVVPGCRPLPPLRPAAGAVELAERDGAAPVALPVWASVGKLQDNAVVINRAAGTVRRLRWVMRDKLSVWWNTGPSLAANRVTWRAEMLAM